ncbi:MAG: phosphoribosylpyrophosphate synthetase [Chitinophagaceae bacterium]|nr:phosphoribosylpyrophosphate synthetase [Chitinophagaceae bacterium]
MSETAMFLFSKLLSVIYSLNEKIMPAYESVIEAINELRQRGFNTDFNLAFDVLKCSQTGIAFSPADFEIVEHYRFEGESDPEDEAVVYAIESKDKRTRGTLVTAYGMYSDPVHDELLKKLVMHEQ